MCVCVSHAHAAVSDFSLFVNFFSFAFVEYESHRAAAMARRKFLNGRVQLWNHQIAIDWAEPELEVDEDIMAQVGVVIGCVGVATESELGVACV